VKAFADLLDHLVYTPGRNAKLRLMQDYFRATPDPDRGYALAALTDGLPFSFPVRRTLMNLMTRRLDPELFRLSRDYVGDTAETVALAWPEPATAQIPPRLGDIVAELELMDRNALEARLEAWLDSLDATGRWALLKLLTGALRVGVSARLAKTAAAEMAGKPVSEVEEIWHGVAPPYLPLFRWLDGLGPRPDVSGAPVFRPLMLSHPLEDADWEALDLADFAVEWKWDGIRVQVAAGRGELLVVRGGEVAPFNDLQQRLNRKTVTKRMLADYPAHLRFYDALEIDGVDVRPLPLVERRARLEAWHAKVRPPATDLSVPLKPKSKSELMQVWQGTRGLGIEGLMLKRLASPYIAGRPRGHWFKWKRQALTLDCVLMYAQRGSGKRSSYYSDYTFGAWKTNPDGQAELVPVGKAYSGYTDAELLELDRWIRNHTTDRFGPVRAVTPGLVLEVAFDAVQRSSRHKSGVAMRFPRINRIRWDKPASEADRLETIIQMFEK
jgi:DNA ligase-1